MRGLLVGVLAATSAGSLAADPAEARGRRGRHVAVEQGVARPVVGYRHVAPPPVIVRYRPSRAYEARIVYRAAPTRNFYDSYDNRPARRYGYRGGSYGYGYVSAPPSRDYIFGALATRGTGTITEPQRFFANRGYHNP